MSSGCRWSSSSDAKFIFTLCDRVLVLVEGQVLTHGSPDEVRGDPRVVAAYLGAPVDAAVPGGERRR